MHSNPGISIRIDPEMKEAISQHEEVNWSAVIRKALQKKLTQLESPAIDHARFKQAMDIAARIRKKRQVTTKTAAEIIREWRDKRQ
ncbi:hypothetical protein HY489_01045 [Candidatus Woesearchaeota archaeon]|nr:hypothetical protein [Candidatus Woesearchaeota archaeon]